MRLFIVLSAVMYFFIFIACSNNRYEKDINAISWYGGVTPKEKHIIINLLKQKKMIKKGSFSSGLNILSIGKVSDNTYSVITDHNAITIRKEDSKWNAIVEPWIARHY